jgi:phosphate uptake regulator
MFKEFFKNWNTTDLLTQSVNDSHEMFKIALEMFELTKSKCCKKVESGTEELGDEIKQKDYLLNHYDKSIRKKIYEHIILSEKEDQELYTSLILFSIVGDIERLGDYIKNMFEVITSADLTDAKLNADLNGMFTNIGNLFTKTIKAYKESEVSIAKEINDEYFKYKTELDEIIEKLIVKNDKES